MAKKRAGSKYELDDYGFSSDLDMPDFDFKVPEVKDDRKPATKAAAAFLGGFKDRVTSPSFVRKAMKESLPKSYGSSFNLVGEASDSLKSLYDNASKEIKPAYNDLKRTTARVMPKAGKFLPKSVADRIKKWSESGAQAAQMSAEAQRESDMALQLGDIFKFQAEDSMRKDAEGDAKDKLREGMAQMRHRDQLSQLDAIRQAVSQNTAYTLGVTSKVQRKSLELQFRQYFVQRDTLTEMKRFNALAQGQMELMVKNTALPDFVKMRKHELFSQFMRNRFMAGANRKLDGMMDRRREFVKNIGSALQEKAMSKVRGFTGGLQAGLMGVDSGMDAAEMAESMGQMGGQSSLEMGAGMLGSGAADAALWGWGGKLGKFLGKNKKIQSFGNKADMFARNLPQRADTWSKQNTPAGRLSGLIDFFKDVAGQALGKTDNQLEVDKVGDLHQQSPWTRQSSKTLNEVIPGFLARIYQELQIMRTGDSKVELTTYDLNKNGFTSRSQAAKSTWEAAFRGKGHKGSMMQVNSLVSKIDKDGKLTPEQREDLGRKLMLANLSGSVGKYGDKNFFTSAKSFGGGENGALYAQLFKQHLAGDDNQAKENELNRRFTDLGKYTSDMRGNLQNQVNLGMLDHLHESGAINRETGQLDMAKAYAYYYGEDFTPTPQYAGGPVAKGRGGRNTVINRTVNRNDMRTMLSANHPGVAPAGPTMQVPSELMEALEANNLKKEMGTVMESLLRVEQLLGHGLVTYTQEEATVGTKAKDPGWSWNMSLRQASRKTLKSFGSSIQWAAKGANQLAGSLTKTLTGTVGTALSIGRQVGGAALDKMRGLRDVFVPGEIAPKLEAARMKAGEYYDESSKKVIKSFKDIRGNVVDASGKIVLTAQDAKVAFVKYGIVKKALSALASLGSFAKDGVNKLIGALGGGLGTLKDVAGRALTWLVAEPQDVYVKGKMDKATLEKRIMAAGGYYSKKTTRPIKHPGQIDGIILDAEGNTALSLEDIKAGLCNRFGKPLRTNLGNLLGIGAGIASRAIGAVMGAARWAGGKLKGGLGKFGNMLSNFKIPGLSLFDSRETNDILVDIRDLLDQRLPAGGSPFGGGKGNPFWDGASTDGLPQVEGQGGSGGGGAGGKAGGAAGEAGGAGKAAGGAAKGGRGYRAGRAMGRAGRAAKGFAKGAWGVGKGFMATGAGKMMGVAGAGLGAYSAYENVKEGNYGSAALDVGMTGLSLASSGVTLGGIASGATALAGGAATVGGALMTGGAALATGIAALLASPVVLGALAVGAVAGLGYLGYKYFTRKKLGDVSKLRYAQYGFSPDDTDHLQAVFGLEDKLKPAITWGGQGPELDGKKMDGEDIAKAFDVDTKNPKQVSQFITWFHNRFKPVFLTHVAGMKAVADDKWLDSVDDLKGPDLKRYFELTKMDGGPYNILTSPFIGGKDLEMDASKVAEVTAKLAEAVAKEKTDDAGKDGLGNSAAAASGAAGAAAGAAGAAGDQPKTGLVNGMKDELTKSPASAVGAAAGAAAGAGLTVKAGFQGYARANGGEMDALTVIRFKSYGLQQMVTEKTRALDALENEVAKNLSFDSKNIATFKGSAQDVMASCAAAFGVQPDGGDASYDWSGWFTQRFLPVFLNYASALAQATGRQDVDTALKALKDNDRVDVAQAVYTTPVWQIAISPWPGYVLNTEVRSIEPNFQALKEGAKKNVADEQKGSKSSKGTGQDSGAGVSDGTTGTGKGFAGAVSGMWNKATSFVSNIGSAIGEKFFNATHDSPNMSLAGGRAVDAATMGAGGAMADLPQPQGSGKYAFFQDLFEKVGKIVGVDPKLMAVMAAIESGFNPSVRAKTSSATGLFQFIDDTWNSMMRKYGAKFGIPQGTPSTDPRANALLGAAYMKENMAALQGARPQISDTDVYMAHFLGAGGAKKFFKAAPGDIAASVLPEAARANLPIFYNPNGSPRTVAEVYAFMNDKVRKKGQQFGLDAGTGTMAQATGPTAAAPATDTGTGAGAGRGSINPVPVTEQVATPVTNTGPAGSTVGAANTESMGMPTSSPVDPSAQGGFNPQPPSRMADVAMTQQANRDDTAKVMGDLTNVSQQQLGVQTDMLGVLRSIERLINGKFAQATGGDQQTAAAAAAGRNPRDMPNPPVSMRKMDAQW